MCESTERAIEADRKQRARLKALDDPTVIELVESELRKKHNIIEELNHRISQWNDTICHNCRANLEGWGPPVLKSYEMIKYEDTNRSTVEFKSAAHANDTKDTNSSQAGKHLRSILANH